MCVPVHTCVSTGNHKVYPVKNEKHAVAPKVLTFLDSLSRNTTVSPFIGHLRENVSLRLFFW